MPNHPRFFPVLDREIARLKKLNKKGLPSVYKDIDEYLYDFWPDFAWDDEALAEQVATLLASPKWLATAAELKEAREWDFVGICSNVPTEEN